MSRSGKGEKLNTGITAYATHYRVVAAIGSRQRETRFELGTAIETMRAWQLTTKAELLGETPTVSAGTLEADVPQFLATIASPKTRQYHLINLLPWVALFGHLPRAKITSVMLRQALATWQTAPRADDEGAMPYAANTLNHRLSSLRRLYTVLDADDEQAVNPCLRVERLATPDPEPREIPVAALEALFAALPVHRYQHGLPPDTVRAIYEAATAPAANRSALARAHGISETAVRKIIDRKGASERATLAASRIRLEVKRRTGLPWKQVGAIAPAHLRVGDPQAPIAGHLWVTPRRKGKGTKGRWLPLTREAMTAVQALLQHCPGPFSASSVYQTFKRALTRAQKTAAEAQQPFPAVPAKLRPYDLRHTFLTNVQRAGRDRKATQGLGLHANPSTSDRYIRGAEADGEEAALTALTAGARTGQDGDS